jgi:hypothetical protein
MLLIINGCDNFVPYVKYGINILHKISYFRRDPDTHNSNKTYINGDRELIMSFITR